MGSKLDLESPINQRIKEILYASNCSVTQFAELIGMKQTTLNQQFIVGKFSIQTLEGILKTFSDVSAEWLMRGVGNMYLPKTDEDKDNLKQENDYLKQERDKLVSQVELLNKVIEKLVR